MLYLYSVTAALQPPHWTERVKDRKRQREQEVVPTSDYHGNPARPISSLQGLGKQSCCCYISGESADLLTKWHLQQPTPCILTCSASDNSEGKPVLETQLILLKYSFQTLNPKLNLKITNKDLVHSWVSKQKARRTFRDLKYFTTVWMPLRGKKSQSLMVQVRLLVILIIHLSSQVCHSTLGLTATGSD